MPFPPNCFRAAEGPTAAAGWVPAGRALRLRHESGRVTPLLSGVAAPAVSPRHPLKENAVPVAASGRAALLGMSGKTRAHLACSRR